ncbi:hypothetical protein MKZ38_000080 [Zalerion maritima]|uniref:C2H2-type domain-containing protein n=1 Tax=Zalerion maritima TaxID=339359 RepID=A0AAD5RT25_9PEZI|nr:hypothetical protein MKZ38_000080 [Zalerion maritima]
MSSLGKGLAEIDGILAGCEYLDLVDQYSTRRSNSQISGYDASIPAYQRQETPDLGSFYSSRCSSKTASHTTLHDGSPRLGSVTPGKEHSKPSASQWEALQTLRDGVDFIFAQFDNLAADNSHVDIIKRLREFYGDAKGMRQSGLLTYKDILQGMSPEELRLEEIFSFSCLSYSLAKFLCVKGKLSETSVLRGLPVWREAVADGEKSTFDFLARSLWPEAGTVLDVVQAEETSLVQDAMPGFCTLSQEAQFMSSQGPLGYPNGLSVTDELFPAAGLGLTQNALACDPSWLMPITPISDQALDLMMDSNSAFAFEDLQAGGPAGGGYDSPLSYTDSICPSLAESPSSSQSPPPVDFMMDTQTPPPLVQRIKNTDMFRVFSIWFSHMYGLKEFLWTLSGEGLFSQKTGKRGGFAAARQLRQFQDAMSDQFFAPLAEVLPSTMVDILKLAKTRVFDGVLSSLRDVERHLFAISDSFDLSLETRKWFLEIILSRCLKISRNMKGCVYGTTNDEAYSEDYVKSRLDSALCSQSAASSPASSTSPPIKRSASQESEDLSEMSQPPKKSSRVTCPICGKSYSGHSNLSRHKKQEHRQGTPPTFRCKSPGCKKVCSRADNLKQHVELVHKKHDI